jgi:hypothetical protein
MNQHVLNYKATFMDVLLGKKQVPGGLAFEYKLQPQWFDFSLESLYYIDSYLMSVFAFYDELEEKQIENTIWAVGFYAGEVIRRQSDKTYRWKNWEEFFPKQNADLQERYFQTMGTTAVLVARDNSFILPICRVIKFLKEGPENSLHFFASQEIVTADV